MTSCEVYRQIWLILIVDPNILIKIEDPATMESRDAITLFGNYEQKAIAAPPTSAQMPTMTSGHNYKKVSPEMNGPEESRTQIIDPKEFRGSEGDSINSIAEEVNEIIETEALEELERVLAEKERLRIIEEKKEKAFQRKRKRVICCQRFCCFKDEDKLYNFNDKMPSYTQVMCWRFLRARRLSTKFHASKDSLMVLEKSGCQVFVSLLISLNYLMLYAEIIVPFILLIMQEETVTI